MGMPGTRSAPSATSLTTTGRQQSSGQEAICMEQGPAAGRTLAGDTHLKGASATAFVSAHAKSATSFQLCTIRAWASVYSCRSTNAWKPKGGGTRRKVLPHTR